MHLPHYTCDYCVHCNKADVKKVGYAMMFVLLTMETEVWAPDVDVDATDRVGYLQIYLGQTPKSRSKQESNLVQKGDK